MSEILYPGVDQTELHADSTAAVSEVDVYDIATAGVVLAGIFSRKLMKAPSNLVILTDEVLVLVDWLQSLKQFSPTCHIIYL